MIDPGHGGHDPGAQARGLNESDLTLDVALRLEKLFLEEAGIEVVLTRRTDDYIPLEERTAIANREGADLFLSIHVNTSRTTSASGVETYFLSFAGTAEAEAVAARENSAHGGEMPFETVEPAAAQLHHLQAVQVRVVAPDILDKG